MHNHPTPHILRTLTPNYDIAVTGGRLFVDTLILKRNLKLATHIYVVNMLSMLLQGCTNYQMSATNSTFIEDGHLASDSTAELGN